MIQTLIRHPMAALATGLVVGYVILAIDEYMRGAGPGWTLLRVAAAGLVGFAIWSTI